MDPNDLLQNSHQLQAIVNQLEPWQKLILLLSTFTGFFLVIYSHTTHLFLKIWRFFYGVVKKTGTLGIVTSAWQENTWHRVTRNDKQFIYIRLHWTITNALSYDLTVVNSFLVKPTYSPGRVLIKHTQSDMWGSYTIPQGYTTDVETIFHIDTKYIKHDADTLRLNVEFEDPFGKRFSKRNIVVKHVKTAQSVRKTKPQTEDISKIKDKAERQVVSVLKNELEQYRVLGRKEGRLGSVNWPKGSLEWRDNGKPIEFVFHHSNRTNVTSEHVVAITKLYNRLHNKKKKALMKALLERINRKSEYRDSGYLILFTLFELGALDKGLVRAFNSLRGDSAYGYSDVLHMLDMLLAFRYDEFKDSDLIAIEEIASASKDNNMFSILQRVNAIRVKRLIASA